jgi:hypothetical protein
MFKLFPFGIVLAVTLVATLASAEGVDVQGPPDETPVASAPADPPAPSGVPPAVGPDLRRSSKSLTIDLKIGGDGIRVGGRMSDSKGVSSAWLGARLRDDGVTVDGRLEGNDGPARDFTLNLDLLPGWARTAARLWLLLP